MMATMSNEMQSWPTSMDCDAIDETTFKNGNFAVKRIPFRYQWQLIIYLRRFSQFLFAQKTTTSYRPIHQHTIALQAMPSTRFSQIKHLAVNWSPHYHQTMRRWLSHPMWSRQRCQQTNLNSRLERMQLQRRRMVAMAAPTSTCGNFWRNYCKHRKPMERQFVGWIAPRVSSKSRIQSVWHVSGADAKIDRPWITTNCPVQFANTTKKVSWRKPNVRNVWSINSVIHIICKL